MDALNHAPKKRFKLKINASIAIIGAQPAKINPIIAHLVMKTLIFMRTLACFTVQMDILKIQGNAKNAPTIARHVNQMNLLAHPAKKECINWEMNALTIAQKNIILEVSIVKNAGKNV